MERIGQGRTAEVFLWEKGTVLKLFRSSMPSPVIEAEVQVNEALRNVALPVPRILDVMEVEGRRGIVFERVEGESMLRQMIRQPWRVGRFARILAGLHVRMHQTVCEELPPQHHFWRQRIRRVSRLSGEEKEKVLAVLDRLAPGMWICHGDFHPDNVLMTSAGPVIIDWNNATSGAPAGDVARTAMLCQTGTLPNPLVNIALRTLAGRFCAVYLQEYLRTGGVRWETVQSWELPLYAARLLESPPKTEEEAVLRRVRELLKGL